jgi:DNA sulfur modification protein DndC
VPNFWGGDNKRLVTMYRNGADQQGECPLVIDTSTASCGNSRFGCWTCTAVDKDKSMTNLIENGEDWMLPLLEFRNVLAEIRQDPTQRMTTSRDNKERLGPFTFAARAELLRQLLEAGKRAGITVISRNELEAIQTQWNYDGCFDYSVDSIYFFVHNQRIMQDNPLAAAREAEELALLREVAEEHGINPDHVRELMMTEKDLVTYLRRTNIFQDIQRRIARFAAEAYSQN